MKQKLCFMFCLLLSLWASVAASAQTKRLQYLVTEAASKRTIYLVFRDDTPTTWQGETVLRSEDYQDYSLIGLSANEPNSFAKFVSTYPSPYKVVVDASTSEFRGANLANLFVGLNIDNNGIQGLNHLNTEMVTNMNAMFKDCKNLTSVDLSNFKTANVVDMGSMFYGCAKLTNIVFPATFTTDALSNMREMFRGCEALTSLDFSRFDTKQVKDLSGTFFNCKSLTSLDLSAFNTAKVNNMAYLFSGCESLASLTLPETFTTNVVTTMASIFKGCKRLPSIDLSKFNTFYVRDMSSMFNGCEALTSLTFPATFTTANVTSMREMFRDCKQLSSLDLTNFTTDKVTTMAAMFYGCTTLTSVDLSSRNAKLMTDMSYLFTNCVALTSVNFSGFTTNALTTMAWMFSGCEKLTAIDLSGFNTTNVTTMNRLFKGCKALTNLNIAGLKMDKVTNMAEVFSGCQSLTSLDLSSFKLDKVETMASIFHSCKNLASVNLTGLNVAKINNMSNMFNGCNSLTSVDLSGFKTSNVTTMEGLFRECNVLKRLDLRHFDGTSLTSANNILSGTYNLIYADFSDAQNFSDTPLTEIFSSKVPFTLLYLPQGTAVTGRNAIVKTATGFTTADYLLSEATTTNTTLATTSKAMLHEVEIPHAFEADKVSHDRVMAGTTNRLYTWYMPYTAPIPAGMEAYEFEANSVNGIMATFKPTTDAMLQAQKPYLLRATGAQEKVLASVDMGTPMAVKAYTPGTDVASAATSAGWKFVGTFQWHTAEEAAAKHLYGLVGGKWKTYAGSTKKPQHMRAFLQNTSGGAAPTLELQLADAITSLQHIELLDSADRTNSRIFDLNGRYLGTRREVLPSGVYVINGQKTLLP